jgi:hypothetical protein
LWPIKVRERKEAGRMRLPLVRTRLLALKMMWRLWASRVTLVHKSTGLLLWPRVGEVLAAELLLM